MRDWSFYFSTEFTEPWASLPHAVQASQGPEPRSQLWCCGWPSLGHFTVHLLLQEQGVRHSPHFPFWAIRTQRGAVAGFRPPRGQARAMTEPGPSWEPTPGPWEALGSKASLKHAPPLLPALPAGGLRGRGGALPAPVTPSPRQRGHTGPNGPGAWAAAARPRGQSRRHGQPLRGGGGSLPGPGVPQQKGRSRRLHRSGPLPQGEGAV